MTSPFLDLPRRDLRQLERAYTEDAKGYMGYAAHATRRGTRDYWEGRAREALAKAKECRRQRIAAELDPPATVP